MMLPTIAAETQGTEQPAAPPDPTLAHPPPPNDAAMRLIEVETAFNEMRNDQQMQITELQEQLQWARRQPAETISADANRRGRNQVQARFDNRQEKIGAEEKTQLLEVEMLHRQEKIGAEERTQIGRAHV